MFIRWLDIQSKEIGISSEEVLEKSNMNTNLLKHWRNEKLINTTNIISIVRTIYKLQKKKTYRELLLEAIKEEARR